VNGYHSLLSLHFVFLPVVLTGSSMQAIITEINEKIGAAGVVSQECKTVVSQYGQQILALLLAEVRIFSWVCLWVCLSISGLINCVCTTLK
jgi:hypothetical protein